MNDKLKKLLRKNDVEERCGLILRNGKIIETTNIAENPELGFEVPVEELFKFHDDLVGTWHTHPGQNSNLSERDYFGFLQWPDLTHYIIGTDGVSAYIVEDGVVLNAS